MSFYDPIFNGSPLRNPSALAHSNISLGVLANPTFNKFTKHVPRGPLLTSNTAALITRAVGTREQKIPMSVRRIIEARGGFDLTGIHLHVGPTATTAAKALGARAFSVSRHIVFDEDEFCLTSDEGLRLLAHEIAHAIRQKDGGGFKYSIGAVGSEWEFYAQAFADFVLDGASRSIRWLSALPVVPAGLVLRHKQAECPSPPKWIQISAVRPEIYLTANYSIELAYKVSHYGHVMIFGGDFTTGTVITLPRNAKLSDIDRRFGNQLLLELIGLMWQLRPDIIDFTERKFYEIKTNNYARENSSKVIEQLASYYRIAEAIRKKYSGPEWREDAPDWYPPHVLPFNADERRIVCTSATEYKIGKEYLNTLNRPGLILYDVREMLPIDKEERKKRANAMRIVDIAPELSPAVQRVENLHRISVVEAEDREYLIVCTWDFFEATIIRKGHENIDRVLSMLRVAGFSIRENPVLMLRFLGWSIIGISEFIYVSVAASLILPEIFAVPGITGTAAAGGPMLIEVPEAIVSGMRAANDVVALKKAAVAVSGAAAGVLFLVGTANARTDKVQIDRVGMVRAIPVHSTWEMSTMATGVKLVWAGTEYFYLGRARSPM